MECEKCGSTDFHEEDGFFFCVYCQTQSQGFAREEITEEDDNYAPTREIRINTDDGEKSKKKKLTSQREGLSNWNTIEAFNEIYIGFLHDIIKIFNELGNFKFSQDKLVSTAMEIWFKSLRESELVFLPNEHLESRVKMHPGSRYRDNFVLGSGSADAELPLFQSNRSDLSVTPYYGMYHSRKSQVLQNVVVKNDEYYDDDYYSDKYKDPRTHFKKRAPLEAEPIITVINKAMIEQNQAQECNDSFAEMLLRLASSSSVSIEEISRDDPLDHEEDDSRSNAFENDYDDIRRDRMSSKSKLMSEYYPLNEKNQRRYYYSRSPLSNDLITKLKLIAILYIAIRLLNYNIFLSDLIRWCIDGNIRYINALVHLPKKWEIMWLDVLTFRMNRLPNYQTLCGVTRNMIIHCKIDESLFPEPDMYKLIARYIKDLNLPKGLIIAVKKRYGAFIDLYRKPQDSSIFYANVTRIPEHEVAAIISVILTLCDLFDLNGKTEKNFQLFKSDTSNLFIWNEWLEYSILRLNVIKAFNLNIRTRSRGNLLNFENTLVSYFRLGTKWSDKNVVSKRKWKRRSLEYRNELQGLFADLFFEPQNEEWKNQIDSKLNQISPTLYPLSSLTSQTLDNITNTKLREWLSSDFRSTLITPYLCSHGFTYHRCHTRVSSLPMFNSRKASFFDLYVSPALKHLVELGSIITSCELGNYHYCFLKAENKATQWT